MKKSHRQLRLTIALAVIIAGTIGCASSARSPLETAKLAYADAAFGYEAAMQSLTELRAAHRVTDAQWAEIDRVQHVVQTTAPQLRASLDLWEAIGTEPSSYQATQHSFTAAVAELKVIAAGVQRGGNS